MASTGRVVTTAGLVFAFTMGSMVTSDLPSPTGTTIMIGLLFDTLVVRSFMTPAVAALLGRWFWWPRRVQTHATPRLARSCSNSALRRLDFSSNQTGRGVFLAAPPDQLRALRP